MASEWLRYQVSELVERGALIIGDGYRAKNSELTDSGLPFARAGNINAGFLFSGADCFPEENLNLVGNKVSQPGDVVFTSKGTVGRFAFVRPDTPRFVYSPQLCYWRSVDRELIDPRFLSFWMVGREFHIQFKGVSGQTDMAEYVSLTDQRRMHITLPPLPEQRAIAHILGTLDDKIGLNRRMNETLEAMARALFKSWFVDFDPVRAKAEGRDTGLPRHIVDLFPDHFDDSEMGEIPAGWKVGVLGEHVEAVRGLSYHGAGLSEGEGLPMHNLNSIYEGGGYKYEGIKCYTGDYKERHLVLSGEIIVANTEQGFDYLLIGFPAIVPKRFGGLALFSHHIYRVRPLPSSPCEVPFLYYLLMTPAVRDQIIGCTNGTTVNMLSIDGLQTPRFALPPKALISKFCAVAWLLLCKMDLNHEESRTLAALRDALLPKLISGEIRVKDAERVASGVP